MTNKPPSWRKPAGALAIVAYITIWAVLVATLSGRAVSWPWPVQVVFFLVSGIVWILPLRPLLLWMETGRWRA
jgi:membrane protein implicated in regulation of membrane protease activity